MSVIFFGHEELGNVAAWLSREPYQDDGDLARLAGLLSSYSIGNAAAYDYRYPASRCSYCAPDAVCQQHLAPTKGHSAAEILGAASSLQRSGKVDRETARATVRLLSYNGPEGEGLDSFRGQVAYRKAMISILGRAFGKVDRELTAKERGRGWEVGFGEGQD